MISRGSTIAITSCNSDLKAKMPSQAEALAQTAYMLLQAAKVQELYKTWVRWDMPHQQGQAATQSMSMSAGRAYASSMTLRTEWDMSLSAQARRSLPQCSGNDVMNTDGRRVPSEPDWQIRLDIQSPQLCLL